MQRKPGFPVANCSIKMPDNMSVSELPAEEDEPNKRRQQLINFGHAQWGFNNWSWSVTKQDLDFVDLTNGKYTVGVAAFVSITVKSLDIHRENIGYATSLSIQKGSAIHNARKCAVTNALRETLLSFGGSVATDLMEQLEIHKPEATQTIEPDSQLPKHSEPKNSPKLNIRKEVPDTPTIRPHTTVPPAIKNAVPNPPPIAKAHPMPVNLPPANRPPIAANAPRVPPPPPGPQVRPNSNDALERMSEEEARAERKRRQRLAQEEFRQKQLMKQKDLDANPEITSHSMDSLLMAIPSQDIEEAGSSSVEKRKSSSPPDVAVKRRSIRNKLVIKKE